MQAIELSPAVQSILDRLRAIKGTEGAAPALPRECYTSADFFEFERQAVFARQWICVGREEQLAKPGDYLAPSVAGEPLIVVRTEDGTIRAMSAICRHRGQVLVSTPGSARAFRCPYHAWTYELNGALKTAPHMGSAEELACLRKQTRLPSVRHEIWHGFIFVNLDADAAPLAPSLAKVEPFWDNYRDAGLVAVPPQQAKEPLPWNWKIQVENFTDAYHPGFVHKGTHDIAPSVHADGGVTFTEMHEGDNAIVRSVPLLEKDAGMDRDGWTEQAMFPPIPTLGDAQRSRLTFVLMPPSMTLIFAPGVVAYALLSTTGVLSTFASNDRVTAGGWLLPQSTLDLPDFAERGARVREGGSKIWAQDVPINLGTQAGKASRFAQDDIYGPLETTLVQFNAWLLRAYRAAMPASA